MSTIKDEVLANTTTRDEDGNPIARGYVVTFTDESDPYTITMPSEHSGDSPCFRVEEEGFQSLDNWHTFSVSGDIEALANSLAEGAATEVAEIEEIDLEVDNGEHKAAEQEEPKRYEAVVSQTTGHHYDDLDSRDGHYTHTITITTDGGDYTDDWDGMSAYDRSCHDRWVEEIHDVLVAVAWCDPDVRERYELMMRGKEWQPESLRLCLEEAKSEVAEKIEWPKDWNPKEGWPTEIPGVSPGLLAKSIKALGGPSN